MDYDRNISKYIYIEGEKTGSPGIEPSPSQCQMRFDFLVTKRVKRNKAMGM